MSYPIAPPVWPGDVRRWHASLSYLAGQPTPDARQWVRRSRVLRFGAMGVASLVVLIGLLLSFDSLASFDGPYIGLWFVGIGIQFAGGLMQRDRSAGPSLTPLGWSERRVLRDVVRYEQPTPAGLEPVVREWVNCQRGMRFSWVIGIGSTVVLATIAVQLTLPAAIALGAAAVALLAIHLRRSVDGYQAERYAVIERALLIPRPFR